MPPFFFGETNGAIKAPKEPWLAATISRLIPGGEQIYAGNKLRGYIILSIAIILYILILYKTKDHNFISVKSSLPLILTLVGFYIWNLFDAYSNTKKRNPDNFEFKRKQHKGPLLAVFIGSLTPIIHDILTKYIATNSFSCLHISRILSICIALKSNIAIGYKNNDE